MSAYSDTANALTRATLQSVIATPGNLSNVSSTSAATSAVSLLDARNSSTASTVNLQNAAIYKNTNLVASLNDSLNANDYIKRLVGSERQRLYGVDNTVRNEQLKLRGKLMAYTYLLNYYTTGTNIVILTLFISMVLLLLAALWKCGKIPVAPFVMLVAVFLVVYAMVVIWATTYVAQRSPSSWDRRMWTVKNQKKMLSSAKG